MNVGPEFEVIEDEKAPKGRRIVRKGEKPAEIADPVDTSDIDTRTVEDPQTSEPNVALDLDAMSDDELRDYVERMTGEKPHHRAGREKLLALLSGE